jgi:hypothetical protein
MDVSKEMNRMLELKEKCRREQSRAARWKIAAHVQRIHRKHAEGRIRELETEVAYWRSRWENAA